VQLLGRLEAGRSVEESAVRAAKEPSAAPTSIHSTNTTDLTAKNHCNDAESENSAAGGLSASPQLVAGHEVAGTAAGRRRRHPASSQDAPSRSSATGEGELEGPRSGGAMLDELRAMQRSLTLEDLHSLRYALRSDQGSNH